MWAPALGDSGTRQARHRGDDTEVFKTSQSLCLAAIITVCVFSTFAFSPYPPITQSCTCRLCTHPVPSWGALLAEGYTLEPLVHWLDSALFWNLACLVGATLILDLHELRGFNNLQSQGSCYMILQDSHPFLSSLPSPATVPATSKDRGYFCLLFRFTLCWLLSYGLFMTLLLLGNSTETILWSDSSFIYL